MTFQEKIRKYMELCDYNDFYQRSAKGWLVANGASPERITKAQKRIRETDFIGALIDLYGEHYTEEEIDGLIAFESSPLGRKLRETNKSITGRKQVIIQKLMSRAVEAL